MQFLGTASPPSSGASWTSDVRNTNTADTINGSIYSSVAGTLHVEQSGDGTNYDIDDTVSISASTGTKIDGIKILCPFVKLVFTRTTGTFNGSETLRIAARFDSSGVKP